MTLASTHAAVYAPCADDHDANASAPRFGAAHVRGHLHPRHAFDVVALADAAAVRGNMHDFRGTPEYASDPGGTGLTADFGYMDQRR